MDKARNLYGTPASGLMLQVRRYAEGTLSLPFPPPLFIGVHSEIIPFQGDLGSLPLAASSRSLQ